MSENVKLNALKEILYGAGISFVLGMIGYVLMFFFKLIAARYFGPAQFGMYEMLMTIFGVAVVFGDFGIVSGIQRYISEYESENKKELLKGYLKFIIYVPLAFSIFISMIVFIFSAQISGFFNFGNEFTLFLRIISLGIPMRVMNSVLVNILIAKRRTFEGRIGYDVFERVVLILGVLLIVYFKLPLGYLIVVATLSLLTSVLTSAVFLKKIKFNIMKDSKFDTRDWILFSLPLIFTGILTYLLNWTDNFVIGKFLDSTSLGIYGVSYSMASYLLFIGGFFATLFLPVMTTLYLKDKKNFDKTFKHVVKWVFITNVFFGSVLIYFSKEVLRIFFGLDYVSGWLSLSVLASFFVLASIFSFSYVTIMIEKKTSFFFYNTLIFAIVNLVLNLVLIKEFGILGVAFASGISLFLIRISEFIKSRTRLDILNLIKVAIIGSVNILFIKILFSYVFNQVYFNEVLKLIIALGVYCFMFVLGLFVFKVFNSEDFELMLLLEKKFGVSLSWIKKVLRKIK